MIVNSLDVGGLEKVVINLIRHLDRDKVVPYLVCLDGPGKLFAEAGLPSDRCLVLKKRPLNLGLIHVDPSFVLTIRKFLKANEIDIVHVHNFGPLVFGGGAARLIARKRPRVVYSEHNQVNSASDKTLARFRWWVRLADQVVAVSHNLQSVLLDRLKISRPVQVIHNGIDGALFTSGDDREQVRAELGVGPDDFLIGTAVVLSEQKGIRYLLEAAQRVLGAAPAIKFVIAGDGPLKNELGDLARTLGLGGSVVFAGYRKDVPRLLSGYDLYVLPSLWEGLPLALLEAMSLGKPIVATRVGGNPEIVEHGTNGFLVPPKDPRALADALLTAYRDRAQAPRMKVANQQKFAAEFSVQAMCRQHERLFAALSSRA